MKITQANYFSEVYPNLDFAKLHPVFKEGHELISDITENGKNWNTYKSIKEVETEVDAYFRNLNTLQEKGQLPMKGGTKKKGSAKGKSVIAKATKAKTAKASRTTSTQKVAAKRAASKTKVEPVKAVAKPAIKGMKSQLNKGDLVIEKSTKRKGIISEKEVDKRGGYVYSFLPNNSTKPTLYYDFLPKSDELNSNKLILNKNPSMIEMPFSNKPKVEPVKVVTKPTPKAKPAQKAKAMAKPKFKVGDYVKSRTQGFIVLVSEVSTINGEYVYKGVNPNYNSNFVEESLIKSTKQAYDKLYGKVTIAKPASKAKADPKKAIKAEISTLQKKSAITATAMRKINSISVETIRQMKGLAGDREMETLKYERDILKALVAKDTARLKRIAKSSNIDANILTDILPKRK